MQDQENTTTERKYHAPRLDEAFETQKHIVKYGKYIIAVPVILYFINPGYAVWSIIGLIGYWGSYFLNKNELESLEISLYKESKEDNLQYDISGIKLFWFKFGPAISFITTIAVIIWVIIKFFYKHRQ